MIFLIYCLPEDSAILGYNAVSTDNLTHTASYLRRKKSSVKKLQKPPELAYYFPACITSSSAFKSIPPSYFLPLLIFNQSAVSNIYADSLWLAGTVQLSMEWAACKYVNELFVDANRKILLLSKSSHRTLQESSWFCRKYFGKCSVMQDQCAGCITCYETKIWDMLHGSFIWRDKSPDFIRMAMTMTVPV